MFNTSNWVNYLTTDDLDTITNFVENTKNDVRCGKALVFCGTGNNGKSTLLREIQDYLGDSKYHVISEYTQDCANTFKELSDGNLFVVVNSLDEFDPSVKRRSMIINFTQTIKRTAVNN
jgi:GTPase SAR1 family protein